MTRTSRLLLWLGGLVWLLSTTNWIVLSLAVWPWMIPGSARKHLAWACSGCWTEAPAYAGANGPWPLLIRPFAGWMPPEVPAFGLVAVALALPIIVLAAAASRRWPRLGATLIGVALLTLLAPTFLPSHWTGLIQMSAAGCRDIPCQIDGRGVEWGDEGSQLHLVWMQHTGTADVWVGSPHPYPWCLKLAERSRFELDGVAPHMWVRGGTYGRECSNPGAMWYEHAVAPSTESVALVLASGKAEFGLHVPVVPGADALDLLRNEVVSGEFVAIHLGEGLHLEDMRFAVVGDVAGFRYGRDCPIEVDLARQAARIECGQEFVQLVATVKGESVDGTWQVTTLGQPLRVLAAERGSEGHESEASRRVE